MIKLDVHDFCHGCPEFNPTVIERPCEEVLNGFDIIKHETVKKYRIKGDTIVSCKDSSKCFAIANHFIEKQIKEKANGI